MRTLTSILLLLFLATPAAALTVTDGDFSTASFGSLGDSVANVTREVDGGSGNAFVRVENVTGPPSDFVRGTILLSNAVWDTTALGAITRVDLSFTARAFAAANQGQAVSILAQNEATGDLYRGGAVFTFVPTNFEPFAINGIVEGNFVRMTQDEPDVVDPFEMPDFSTGVWRFGFTGANSGSSGNTMDYDDVMLTIVPEPGTGALLMLGFSTLAGLRGRSAAGARPLLLRR